jgi:hypothetical protein
MSWVKAFGRFWYDFIVGDDWTVALIVVVGVATTWALVQAGINAWWLLPGAVVGVLTTSLWRARRAVQQP